MAVNASANMVQAHTMSVTSELSSKLNIRENELSTYKGKLDATQGEVGQLNDRLHETTKDRDLLKKDADEWKDMATDLTTDMEGLKQAVKDKMELLEKQRQSTWQCEADLKRVSEGQASQDDTDKMKHQILELKRKNRASQDEANTLKDQIRDLERKGRASQDKADTLKQRISELKRKIREWHKNSRAWYLEPLPKEMRN